MPAEARGLHIFTNKRLDSITFRLLLLDASFHLPWRSMCNPHQLKVCEITLELGTLGWWSAGLLTDGMNWHSIPPSGHPRHPPPIHTTSCWSMFIVAFQRKLEENTHMCIFSKPTLGRVCRIGCSSSKLCSGQPILPLPLPISSANSCSSHSHTSGILYIREILPHHMKCLCSLQCICWVGWIGYTERSW